MDTAEFDLHVRTVSVRRPINAIWLHHTATTRTRWSYSTLENVKCYYEGLEWVDANGKVQRGWTAGPHLFIGDEGIWLFTSLAEQGVGVAGHNVGAIHVEMIGTYDRARPDGALWANTVSALRSLLGRWSVPIRFHREASSKTCPGSAVTMDWVMAEIAAPAMPEEAPEPPDELAGWLSELPASVKGVVQSGAIPTYMERPAKAGGYWGLGYRDGRYVAVRVEITADGVVAREERILGEQ